MLYVLKKYRRESAEKKILNKVAAKYLRFRLKIKAMRSLGLRVERNQLLRQDLIKRYWIHNSEDEEEDIPDTNNTLCSEGLVKYQKNFEEEFF